MEIKDKQKSRRKQKLFSQCKLLTLMTKYVLTHGCQTRAKNVWKMYKGCLVKYGVSSVKANVK